jgi:hypothetical protein
MRLGFDHDGVREGSIRKVRIQQIPRKKSYRTIHKIRSLELYSRNDRKVLRRCEKAIRSDVYKNAFVGLYGPPHLRLCDEGLIRSEVDQIARFNFGGN